MKTALFLWLFWMLGLVVGRGQVNHERQRADQWRAVADSLCINHPNPGSLTEFHRRCYQIDGEIK